MTSQSLQALPAALAGDPDALAAFVAPFDALIFDLDGTLFDTMPLHEVAWRETLINFNLPIDPPFMRSLVGVPAAESLLEIARRADIDFSARLAPALAFKAARVDALRALGVAPTPFVELARATARYLPQAVGTGSLHGEAVELLEGEGLMACFGVIIGADNISRPKPAPDTFTEAARLLGVDPGRCCVFEDGDAGLVAARAGGMFPLDIRAFWRSTPEYFAS